VRDDDAGERDDEREREVEDARRERDRDRQGRELRICFAVARFGNVSGAQSENSTMIPSQT
jgi:hypothetical protein